MPTTTSALLVADGKLIDLQVPYVYTRAVGYGPGQERPDKGSGFGRGAEGAGAFEFVEPLDRGERLFIGSPYFGLHGGVDDTGSDSYHPAPSVRPRILLGADRAHPLLDTGFPRVVRRPAGVRRLGRPGRQHHQVPLTRQVGCRREERLPEHLRRSRVQQHRPRVLLAVDGIRRTDRRDRAGVVDEDHPLTVVPSKLLLEVLFHAHPVG